MNNNGLYKIQKKDIPKAAAVLAEAFDDDPIWSALFEGESNRERKIRAFFECPIRICLTYGEVRASSEHLEGVAAWVPGCLSNITMRRVIRSGSLLSGIRSGTRVLDKSKRIFGPMERDRKENMSGRIFTYLNVIGVAPALQGQGHGGKILRYLTAKSDKSGIPIYLETETENNVIMYEKYGFNVVRKIELPLIGLPMWEMLREPELPDGLQA